MTDTPTPGSDAARERGCQCSVADNARGAGYLGGVRDRDGNVVFVMSELCPLHGGQLREDEGNDTR